MRLRWLEDVREMKIKRWRQKAVGREEWAPVNGAAEALRGKYSRGVCQYKKKISSYRAVNTRRLVYKNLSVNTIEELTIVEKSTTRINTLCAQKEEFLMLNMLIVHKVTARFFMGYGGPYIMEHSVR